MTYMLPTSVSFGVCSAFGIAVVRVPFGITRGAPLPRLHPPSSLYICLLFFPSGLCCLAGYCLSSFRR
jgi:hypothetical protein